MFTTSLKSTLNVFVCNYFSVLQNVQINKTVATTTKITCLSLKCESRINISAHKHVVSSFMCLCDDVCILYSGFLNARGAQGLTVKKK